MNNTTYLNFVNQHIYVGLDVHKKQWNVSVTAGNLLLSTMTRDPDVGSLVKYLRRNYPGAIYHCVYEAGFCGFWIHDQLIEAGIDCIVVNPADIPTTNKEKDRKTDKVDSRKLSRCLSNGELQGIQVLDNQSYEDRSILRTREFLVKDQTRTKNRIKALLKFFNIETPETDTHWSKKYMESLRRIDKLSETGKTSLTMYLNQLQSLRNNISETTKFIRSLSKKDPYSKQVELLVTIPGISILSAMILLTEIGNINEFNNINKLCGFVGLIPSQHSTGDSNNLNHMTRRGKGILKRIFIEASWVAVRKDPGLLMNYKNLLKRVRASRAIITIARKMIARVMFVLKNEEPYKFLAK